jgi:hypothetical protein
MTFFVGYIIFMNFCMSICLINSILVSSAHIFDFLVVICEQHWSCK